MNKIKIITQLLDQFMREEVGNRLSQFAMIALKDMIINELKQGEDIEEKKVKE